MEREHLTAEIDEVAPTVPHQVVQTIHFGQQDADVSPIDALETGRHEDVGKASRHGLQGAQGGGAGLAVDVYAVDVLGRVDGPQQPLGLFDFVVHEDAESDREVVLLQRERPRDVSARVTEACAVGRHREVVVTGQRPTRVRVDIFTAPVDGRSVTAEHRGAVNVA